MESIRWPEEYLPGFTDNFCSNEIILRGFTATDVWALLVNPHVWPTYYANSASIVFDGTELRAGDRFDFDTFGFPVKAEVTECVPPAPGVPGRIAWHGWAGEGAERLDVIHAWLVEELPLGRVRVLTQESQKGEPAKTLAKTRPNPMVAGHQQWLEGIADTLAASNL
ncbi:SRPBCC domain-containing protein [Sutterella sp.]|uniref:SRPBCC domain-containing protein n=1 Tax=Sutterella sp. TaxID=1981025 RepID=UPI0026E09D65|nr:SRPBCC domain-containing protein [Sutterella sp.]MDO5532999.1 SRPBCC domain-containing protein [Sutterella sp.]